MNVTDDPKQVGPVDVVLFAVKLWDTETAGEQTRPLITLQNGVDSVERLVPILGEGPMIGGTAYVVTTITRPGVIRHTGTSARIRCGRLDRHPDDVLNSYVEQIKAAHIDITLTDHILLDLWKKFVLLTGNSGATASTRQPLGVIRDDEDMRAFLYKLMHETIAVGSAAGLKFPPNFQAELDALVAGFAPTMKASMANDLDAGNRLELDWLAGKVGRPRTQVRCPHAWAGSGLRDTQALPDGTDTVAPAAHWIVSAAPLIAAVHESAFGTKQTFQAELSNVRFRGKADIAVSERHVWF